MNWNFPENVEERFLVPTTHAPTKQLIHKGLEEVLKRENVLDERKKVLHVKDPLEQQTGRTLTKRNPNFHYIRGKAYDLRSFYEKHPGGKDILQMTQGIVDATPTFEMYHAFANRPMILKQLEGYRVKDEYESLYENDNGMYLFEEDGFYRTLTKRVKEHFGATGDDVDKKSLTKETKANFTWACKVSIQATISLIFFYLAFFYFKCDASAQLLSSTSNQKNSTTSSMTNEMNNNNNVCIQTVASTLKSMVCAIIAGNFFIQFGFTCMHDASHFAIAPRNHWINTFLTRLWCSLALWTSRIWMLHHAVLHHSFTGVGALDPDLHHATPLVRKSADVERMTILPVVRWLGESFGIVGWGIGGAIIYVLLPGMWLGQVLQYFAFSFKIWKWKDLWGMTFPTQGYETTWWERFLIASHLLLHVYRWNIFVTYALILSLNFSYVMCIVADHDTLEAAVTNHVDVDAEPLPKLPQELQQPDFEPTENNLMKLSEFQRQALESNYGKVDWGETQVRNSSNFSNHWGGDLFAFLHGSINYQIEHHLFPGMSHIHYPCIAPIVRKTCEEFNIPYASYSSLPEAWYSFIIVLKSCMTSKDLAEKEQHYIPNETTKKNQ